MIQVRGEAGSSYGTVSYGNKRWPCRLGRTGIVPAAQKREGDGATPAGTWPMRRLFYRPDRLDPPACILEKIALHPGHLWCDDPGHALYNRLVTAPFTARHEQMWRRDHRYDLVVELGYNDAPSVPGLGSAIFLHLMEADGGPTEGCVAVERDPMEHLLRNLGALQSVQIYDPHTQMADP